MKLLKLAKLPKISIVTPSLNQGQFLQVCIDSVRSQNWANIEHFVIDGGSTDNTMDVIRQNEDWLSGYVSEPDKGAADAINKGLEKCTGDIIAWLNADDFYLPGALEEVAKAYEADPDASFWFGNGIRADEDGHEIAVFNKKPHALRSSGSYPWPGLYPAAVDIHEPQDPRPSRWVEYRAEMELRLGFMDPDGGACGALSD